MSVTESVVTSGNLILQNRQGAFMKTAEIADGQETHHQQVVNIFRIISPISMLWLPNVPSHWSNSTYQKCLVAFGLPGIYFKVSLSWLHSLHWLIVSALQSTQTHCLDDTAFMDSLYWLYSLQTHCLGYTTSLFGLHSLY